MADEASEMKASQAPAPPEEVQKSAWGGFQRFLTQGNARWQTLGAVLVVGAIIGVVTSNPAAVEGLRQNLLLKNHAQEPQNDVHKIRAALSGVDPMHHYWDDVRAMRRGGQRAMQVPGMQQEQPFEDHIGQAVTSEEDRVRADCFQACRANGYSPNRAGPAATKACVDVCLEEKGLRPTPPAVGPRLPVNKLSARAMKTLRSRRVSVRGGAAAAALSSSAPMAAAQRLLDRLQAGGSGKRAPAGGANSLAGEMSALGVNGLKLPQKQSQQLAKGVKMDGVIGDEEVKTAKGLQRQWRAAEKKMVTVEAARLTNAKNLARAAAKAEEENKATEKLDASLVAAAQNYAATVGGSDSGTGLPLNAAKAQKQLATAKGDDEKLRAAAQTAADIYREEKELWEDVKPLTEKQLAGAKWVMPGEQTMEAQWGRALDGAGEMPAEESKAVRLAAMSNGKLLGMEKAEYSKNREATAALSKHIKDLQAARAANAEMLRKKMAQAATRTAAAAQLLQAESRFEKAGGKLGPDQPMLGGGSGSDDVATDKEEVEELDLAAQGAEAMLKRYSEELKSGVGSLVSRTDEDGAGRKQGGQGGSDSILGRLEKGISEVTGTGDAPKRSSGRQRPREATARPGERGVEAVDQASKGWFHLW